MTKHVGQMQQHILNKTLTVTRSGSRIPTLDKVTEAATERFSFE